MDISSSRDPSVHFYLQRENAKKNHEQALHDAHLKQEANLKDLQKDHEKSLEHLQDTQEQHMKQELLRYEAARDRIKAKQSAVLEEERRAGGAQLRNLKQTQARYQGEIEFTNSQKLQDLVRDGANRLANTQKAQDAQLKYVEETGRQQLDQLQFKHAEDMRIQNALSQEKLKGQKREGLQNEMQWQTRIQNLRDQQAAKLQEDTARGQEKYKLELSRLEEQFRHHRDQLIKDQQIWLDWTDAAQEKDPFFQLFRLPYKVHSDEDTMMVSIPRDPGGHMEIRTSLQEKYFVLSGTRQNKHEAISDEGPQSCQSTFQSFCEKIPLDFQVDTKKIQHLLQNGRDLWILPRKR
jgi:hypothetical protein